MSGYLEQCCLLLSANESYERSQQDIEVLTGMSVSHSTHQRLVGSSRGTCKLVQDDARRHI